MDLNDKIEIQNKLVEEINKNIDSLINEEDIDKGISDKFSIALKKAQNVIDNLKSQSKSPSIGNYSSSDDTIDIESVKLSGGEVEFVDEFSGKKINFGSSKGFKVSSYTEDSKGYKLYISGKNNSEFKKNGLEDAVLIITLPYPIETIKPFKDISVRLEQLNIKTKEEEKIGDTIINIRSYKER